MILGQGKKKWKIRELIKFSIDFLEQKGIDEARLNTELLLSHALQCPRLRLYTEQETILSNSEIRKFKALLERRINHEPYQYIIGSANFMGLTLRVDQRVLIPRPETEVLVDSLVMYMKEFLADREAIDILDIGCGSGNIPIALCKFMQKVRVVSIDVSQEALDVAKLNATVHGVKERITFLERDVFNSITEVLAKQFHVIVSNPPYVGADEWETLQTEIRRYEPRNAVSDFKDGYSFYKRISEISSSLLEDDGCIAFEVGYGQMNGVSRILRESGLSDQQIISDLSNIPRVIIAKR